MLKQKTIYTRQKNLAKGSNFNTVIKSIFSYVSKHILLLFSFFIEGQRQPDSVIVPIDAASQVYSQTVLLWVMMCS